MTWFQQHAMEVLMASLLALTCWNLRRFITTQDSHEQRIAKLENGIVTRDDFDELRHSLTATATHNQERTEARLDELFKQMAGLR